jgi:hypothetical protein
VDHLEALKQLHALAAQHIQSLEAGIAPASLDWKSIVKTILTIVLQFLSTPTPA